MSKKRMKPNRQMSADSLNPKSMAVIHGKRISLLSGEAKTPKTRLDFSDGSYFTFQLNSADPQYRSWGEQTAFSYQFSNDVSNFIIKQNGFSVIFKDNSKLDYDLTNAIAENPKIQKR